MTTFKKIAAGLIAASLMAGASAVSAAPLQLDITFDVTRGPVLPNTFPSDPGGLDGSTFTISSIFADGTTFQQDFASAASTAVTVSGASVASSNGTFNGVGDIGLYESSTSGGFGLYQDLGFLQFLDGFEVPGIIASVKLDANGSVGAQSDGSPVTFALLQGLSFRGAGEPGSASLFSGFQSSNFQTGNIQVSASEVGVEPPAVPLPAGFPLMLAAFGGLAMLRRRTKAA